ncbi:MAG: YdcH family protein [Reyranellaceae bacterium]
MDELDELRARFDELQREHRDLDAEIARLTSEQPFDQLQVQRLKKRKLALKDQIIALHEKLIPDIIA